MKFKKSIFIIIVLILASYGIFYLANKLNKKVNTVMVTIPEGYTNKEIGQKLEKSGLVTEKDFINQAENWTDNDYWFLKGLPNDKHKLDGFLYPATYSFSKNVSSKTIINKMLRTFQMNIEPNKKYITENKLSIRNIVITASLIEKEAVKDVDRPKIASVIYNRLNKNMPLQIDATILYIIGHKDKLYNKDLVVQSPYNTYLNKGLPPSPICNPGTKSINAAIHPSKTDYLYYVLNSKTNEHVFAKTYAQHAKNVSLYIK
ncbi:endolytic transglycosylase MltG [Clostridium estertheticum]|uniref:endolytic transglycosylase MltG n=1 Tax=Clostridium estertheticum TaxID=238834 RepID=UPI001CD09015|nr:endolytic transglycosylase MltG [Clostridium estertheticum]MBZ9686705.1 endolytic transglycosylase MltG [Clostridium estertheticum]